MANGYKPKKEGYLTKEGYTVKNWKKRWFVLGKDTLNYYKNNKSLKKVQGVISVRDIQKVEIAAQYKKKQDVLLITTPRRTYYAFAESKAQVDEWRSVLDDQINNANKKSEEINQDPNEPDEKVCPDSFEMLTIIGQGSFGKVVQVRHKSTGDVYAMKILNKKKHRGPR